MRRIAFLGPRGTFTEEALLSERDLGAAEHVPKGSIPEVIAAVGGGEADAAVVPLENAIEGSIDLTVDALVFGADVLIRRELIRPISLNLVARPATRLRDVRAVVSIPAATGQCREWLERRLPGVELLAANPRPERSSRLPAPPSRVWPRSGGRLAADLYGLSVLAAEIEDHPENVTRFAVLGHGVPAPTGHDKTTIVCFQRADRPGAARDPAGVRGALDQPLEPPLRPTKEGLGRLLRHRLRGHIADELVADALRELSAKHGRVKFLGSIQSPSPRTAAPAVQPRRRRGVTRRDG